MVDENCRCTCGLAIVAFGGGGGGASHSNACPQEGRLMSAAITLSTACSNADVSKIQKKLVMEKVIAAAPRPTTQLHAIRRLYAWCNILARSGTLGRTVVSATVPRW